jgi:hypothetical protein
MRGCASSLLTRCSTELRRPKVSFLSSRKSRCITSSCVAMCSTAEVNRTTASCWLWARLDRPIEPIAAQDNDAPATAAKISIIAAGGYFCILATLAATELPAMGRLTAGAISLPSQLGFTRLVLQCCGAGFAAYCHGCVRSTRKRVSGTPGSALLRTSL